MMESNVRTFFKFLENDLTIFSLIEICIIAHLREVYSKFKSDLHHPVVLDALKNSTEG